MNVPYLTDQDIEDCCKQAVDKLRDDLIRERFELMRQHALEDRCASIEEEMTDAGKSDERLVKFTISVNAAPMLGKTTVLLSLLEALADNGHLSVNSTYNYTLNPERFFIISRIENTDTRETLELDIDLNSFFPR